MIRRSSVEQDHAPTTPPAPAIPPNPTPGSNPPPETLSSRSGDQSTHPRRPCISSVDTETLQPEASTRSGVITVSWCQMQVYFVCLYLSC